MGCPIWRSGCTSSLPRLILSEVLDPSLVRALYMFCWKATCVSRSDEHPSCTLCLKFYEQYFRRSLWKKNIVHAHLICFRSECTLNYCHWTLRSPSQINLFLLLQCLAHFRIWYFFFNKVFTYMPFIYI